MNVAVLKKLGLTMYEAQAYVTLTSLISSTATEISEKSGIPRSKIYEVLKGLVQKEYVDVEDGRPLTYNVRSPVEVLSREKTRLNEQIDDTISSLTYVYENGMSQVQAPIWRIYGVERIISREIEIIERARTSINMRIGFLLEGEGEALVRAFRKRRNFKINILASPTCYINDELFDIVGFFEENGIEVYKADIPFAKVLISDSKEMMHIYAKFSEDKRTVIPESTIGILNKYEDIAKNYDERFMNQLNKIQNKNGNK